MRILAKSKALDKLHAIKTEFAELIRRRYEHRAKSCATCETPGACCLDAHFVNVRITPLEAEAIVETLSTLDPEHRRAVYDRVDAAIEKYDLKTDGDTSSQAFACPLFEKGIGCLVHERGKPLPCIAHACYENREDLPPDDLLAEQEVRVEKLNRLTYGKAVSMSPLPLAITRDRVP